MKKSMRTCAVLLALTLIPAVAFAASPWTSETTYTAKTKGKLVFGLKNLLGGWSEVITQPINYHQAEKSGGAGIAKGLFNAVVYTVGGALHVVTAPIPVDVPLPNNGIA